MQREVDASLLCKACKKDDNGALSMRKNMIEVPNASDEDPVIEEGCPADFLALLPHYHSGYKRAFY